MSKELEVNLMARLFAVLFALAYVKFLLSGEKFYFQTANS